MADIVGTGASLLALLGAAAKAIQQIRDARSRVKAGPDALDKTLHQLNNLEYSLKLVCEVKALQTESVQQQVLFISTVATELRVFLEGLAQEQQKKPLTQLLNALKLGDKDDKRLQGILDRLDRSRDELSLRITIAQASITLSGDPCLQDLYSTDPRDDKARIEEIKGGLLYDSYKWVLDHDDFKKWRSNGVPLLWIKADPGKGKTMLLCGIINEIMLEYAAKDVTVSFFFCQSTDLRLNSATAVLRGLAYLLASQHPLLLRHVRAEYEGKGKQVFEDTNAWIALSKSFMNMIDDPSLKRVCLVVDALDECDKDLRRLLTFILQTAKHPKIKWLVSSRNVLEIEKVLKADDLQLRLCLEVDNNITSVVQAVGSYIESCLSTLENIIDEPEILELVRRKMLEKANGTFLWVSLVAKELREAQIWDVEQLIDEVPPDLEHLYERMLQQIDLLKLRNPQYCRALLSTVLMAKQPLSLEEVGCLAGLPPIVSSKPRIIHDIIKLCGSFLVVKDERVFMVHQSAKDFLLGKVLGTFFQTQEAQVHRRLYLQSLETLTDTLGRDMYALKHPGFRVHDMKTPKPDPLRRVEYSSVNWIVHLQASSELVQEEQEDGSALKQFLSYKFLYWLEALSLTGRLSEAISSMQSLNHMVQDEDSGLGKLVHDQHRFVQHWKAVIEEFPLQLYTSALIFTPEQSLTRQLFAHERPRWAPVDFKAEESWRPRVQVIERPGQIECLTYSPTRQLLAAGMGNTIELWNTSSKCIQILEGHQDEVYSVSFSPNGLCLVSASKDRTVKIWNEAGSCTLTLDEHIHTAAPVQFSSDDQLWASATEDYAIRMWSPSGTCVETLSGHTAIVFSLAFTSDNETLASASFDMTLRLWDRKRGDAKILDHHSVAVTQVRFSPNDQYILSAYFNDSIKLWSRNGECLQRIVGDMFHLHSVIWLPDSVHFASSSHGEIKLWDLNANCLKTFPSLKRRFESLVYIDDRRLVAVAAGDHDIDYWDLSSQSREHHSTVTRHIIARTVSPNGELVAATCLDNTNIFHSQLTIWTRHGKPLLTIPHSMLNDPIPVFSPDSRFLLLLVPEIGAVKVWDVSKPVLHTLETCSTCIAFSRDNKVLTNTSKGLRLWDYSGTCLERITLHFEDYKAAAFSSDDQLLVLTKRDATVDILDRKGACVKSFVGPSESVSVVGFCFNDNLLALVLSSREVQIWDTQGNFLQSIPVAPGQAFINVDTGDASGRLVLMKRGSWSIEESEDTWHGYGLDDSCTWVTCKGQSIIYIPKDYRGMDPYVSGKFVAMVTTSGTPAIMSFPEEPPIESWT